MILLLGLLALAGAFGHVDSGPRTAACARRDFVVSFDPARGVTVTSGGRVVASATFAARNLGCRRIPDPKRFVAAPDATPVPGRTSFRCVAPAPIRIHVAAIRNEAGKAIGSSLLVGAGVPFRIVVSAVLKPGGSRVYRARSACKLGAR